MLMMEAIFRIRTGRELMNDEAQDSPEAGSDDGDEEGEKRRQDGGVASREGDSAPYDDSSRPVDPRTGVDGGPSNGRHGTTN